MEDPNSDGGYWQEGIQELVAEGYSRKVSSDTLRGCKQTARTRDPETGYVYKNGGYYYTTVINDSNEFIYDFTSSGMYAVSCYLISKTGEKYLYNFKAININDDKGGE